MSSSPRPLPPEASLRPAKARTGAMVAASVLPAGAIAALALGGALIETKAGIWGATQATDSLNETEKQARETGFAALSPVTLVLVSDKDRDSAVQGMGLTEAQKTLLIEALAPIVVAAPASSGMAVETAQAAKTTPAIEPPPKALAARTARQRTQLAWLTLWDTNAEDGDVVRIDSGGYQRTVTLYKKPVTFAVPVPANGIIHVTGINDGDGGGVTVGLASGATQAVFPIMSVGQTLGLHVRIN